MQNKGRVTKNAKAPEGNKTLILAERYGQSPESVEKWEPYWINRAWTVVVAEGIEEERKAKLGNKPGRR